MKIRENNALLNSKNWDILIILDACRFDSFELLYPKYFVGELNKIQSAGSATPQWRNNNFSEPNKDIIYISSNPFIGDSVFLEFNGDDIFHKVYPVWKTHWDTERGTVKPSKVTNTAIEAIGEHKDKRVIIHYLQPHAPYLGLETIGFQNPNSKEDFFSTDTHINKKSFRGFLYNNLLKFFKKHGMFGNNPEWFASQFLLLPPQSPMDAARRKVGKKKLKELYIDNLERVLLEICLLLDNIDTKNMKIIISSDHGEFLGENNMYAHPLNSDHEILRMVPWFQWQQTITTNRPDREIELVNYNPVQDDINIENKLKNLGYM